MRQLPEIERLRFGIWTSLLGWLLDSESPRCVLNQRRLYHDCIVSSLADSTIDSNGRTEIGFERLLSIASKTLGGRLAVAYAYDENPKLLKGVAAYNTDTGRVKKVSYTADLTALTNSRDQAFSVKVFRTGKPAYVVAMSEPPVAQDDRSALGIASSEAGIGVPAIFGGRCLGAMVFVGPWTTNPLNELADEVSDLSEFAGLLLWALQLEKRYESQRKARKAEEVCMSQVELMCQQENYFSNLKDLCSWISEPLKVFLRDSASVFDASHAAIFTALEPISMEEDPNSIGRYVAKSRNMAFQLRIGSGYRDDLISSESLEYTTEKPGLTSEVLRTLMPTTSENVQSDSRWSQQHVLDSGLRSWIGVPILWRAGGKATLYGVISFTRARVHERDDRGFGPLDIQFAATLASLLALAFHNLYEGERSYDELRRRIHSFLHSIRLPFEYLFRKAVEDVNELKIDDDSNELREFISKSILDRVELLNASYISLRSFSSSINGLGFTTAEFSGSYDVIEVLFRVWRVLRSNSAGINMARPRIVGDNRVMSVGKYALMSMYCHLIENAVKACRENRRPGIKHSICSWIRVGESGAVLCVTDTGCGMGKAEMEKATRAGYSGFSSGAGLGLSIIQNLLSRWSPRKGELDIRRERVLGLQVRVVLPLS